MYNQMDSSSVLKLAEYRRKDLRRSITASASTAESRVIQFAADAHDPAA